MRRLSLLLLFSCWLLPTSAQTASLQGRVLDASTRLPLPDAQVALIGTSYTTQTTHEGAFAFDQLPAGPYTLEIRKVGYELLRVDRIPLAASETRKQRFFLVDTLRVGTIRGQIVDALTGDPLPGSFISLTNTRMGAISDVDGFFEIRHVPPGTYTVRAAFLGFFTEVAVKVQVEQQKTVSLRFALEEDPTGFPPLVLIHYHHHFRKPWAKTTHAGILYTGSEIESLAVGN